MKISQSIKTPDMQVLYFSRQNLQTFDITCLSNH